MGYIAALLASAVLWLVVSELLKRKRRQAVTQALLDQARATSEKFAAYAEREYGALGCSTEEILRHEGDDRKLDVLGALCHRIGQKASSGGDLTETERRLCAAYFLEGQVMNGGFDQYFFNSTGNDCEVALAGLKDIGATAAAALLERAMAVFPGGRPPVDRQQRHRLMTCLGSRSRSVWDQCDDEFYHRGEKTYELCLTYAKRNRAEIVLP